MKRQVRNYVVNLTMLLLALFEASSGFVLWLILPRGGRGYMGGRGTIVIARDSFLWSRDTWLGLHDWVGIALVVVVLLHLALHWRWIVYMTGRLLRRK